MLICAIDTSFAACSVSLVKFSNNDSMAILGRISENMQRGHAEKLIPMIKNLYSDADIDISTTDRIAVTSGPGTFTGLRVGISAARGLALSINCPSVGVGTMHAMAQDVVTEELNNNQNFAVVLDARREQVYMQTFNKEAEVISDATVKSPMSAANELYASANCWFGSGGAIAKEALAKEKQADICLKELPFGTSPSPESIAKLGYEIPESLLAEPVKPIYLRPPDAKPQSSKVLERK